MRTVGPRAVWVIAFALGGVTALIATLTGFLGFVFVLLVIPGLGGRTWLAAMSGGLVGFGPRGCSRLGGGRRPLRGR